jgi:hypothetical protein
VKRTRNLFQRLPFPVAIALSVVTAGTGSLLIGVTAGWGAIYIYDRGNSKGNDVAVGISALLAAGTFVFVTAFTSLSKLHHDITWRTPGFALGCCLVSAAAVTCLLWDSYYFEFILTGWAAVTVCGSLAVWIVGRFVGVEPG